MKNRLRLAAVLLLLPAALLACEDDDDGIVYRADLSGANEVPVRTTSASRTQISGLSLTKARTVAVSSIDKVGNESGLQVVKGS